MKKHNQKMIAMIERQIQDKKDRVNAYEEFLNKTKSLNYKKMVSEKIIEVLYQISEMKKSLEMKKKGYIATKRGWMYEEDFYRR